MDYYYFLYYNKKDDVITFTNNSMNINKSNSTYVKNSNIHAIKDDHINTSNDSQEEMINTEQISFITPQNSAFEYSGSKLVEWSNPHNLLGYFITIMNTSTWQIETPQIYVQGCSLDVDTLGLNPATYRLMLFVTDPNNKFAYMKYFDFTVSEPVDWKLLSPVTFDTDFYSYHVSDDKYISFYPKDTQLSYQVSLLDYNGAKRIVTKTIKDQRMNINDLSNSSGYYSLIIQSKKDKLISKFAKVDISIVEDDIPKRATFNVKKQ